MEAFRCPTCGSLSVTLNVCNNKIECSICNKINDNNKTTHQEIVQDYEKSVGNDKHERDE